LKKEEGFGRDGEQGYLTTGYQTCEKRPGRGEKSGVFRGEARGGRRPAAWQDRIYQFGGGPKQAHVLNEKEKRGGGVGPRGKDQSAEGELLGKCSVEGKKVHDGRRLTQLKGDKVGRRTLPQKPKFKFIS